MNQSIDPNAIAVIGMAGRFPGADSVTGFWANLVAGKESVQQLSDAELDAAGVPAAVYNKNNYVKACAYLDGPDLFDAGFFGYNPREAELIDPQQRVLLECAWEAMEDAGYDPSRYDGAVAVFAGSGKNHYFLNNLLPNKRINASMGEVAIAIGNEKDFVATRLSYKLNLSGPSVTVQNACSTSLLGVHLACQSLLNSESDMAMAGGVAISGYIKQGYTFVEGGIFSPDGHLNAFDIKAGGQLGGNGATMVVLKRLEDALEDGDRIVCVIKGSAANNDGTHKVSFTAPAVDGQAKVIAEAHEVAGVTPESIEYVECHGTGTNLGDPIEVAALTQAFRMSTAGIGICGIGSVKTNVGHLDAAAGVAGLIKASLSLAKEQIPASLNFSVPNPALQLESSPFFVNDKLRPWPKGKAPRRAGVSAFGMGGTNVHLILEEAPELPELPIAEGPEVLLLSARSAAALARACERLAAHLESPEGAAQSLADVAHTLQVGRKAFGVRRAVVAKDHAQAIERLRDARERGHVLSADALESGGKLAFLFSGQGSQYVQMTRDLYAAGGVFRAEFDRACELATAPVGLDLRELIFAPEAGAEAASAELQKTQYTQPALFIVEYALAQHFASLGVEPAAMLGHSIGEYVAACLAGVFSLEAAIDLVAARGRLIGSLPAGGEMLSVALPEAELQPLLGAGVSISVINAPGMCVVSGLAADLDSLRTELRTKKVSCTRLRTSHAFHSALMDPILAEFQKVVEGVALAAPAARVVSCTTGTWLSDAQATDPGYWVRHLREPVRFLDGAQTLLSEFDLLLEVGPGEALTSLSKLCAMELPKCQALVAPSTRSARSGANDVELFLQALGHVWSAGGDADWSALRGGAQRRRVSVCTYPFEHQRYWVEPEHSQPELAAQKDPNLANWFWVPSWRRLPALQGSPDLNGQRWLLYMDQGGLGEALASELRSRGALVQCARAGAAYQSLDASNYTLQPNQREQQLKLLGAAQPERIVYLMSAESEEASRLESLERESELGFYGLLALGQALGDMDSSGLRLEAITCGMQNVLGDLLHPEKAPVIGVVKAICAELPLLECRSVDLESGGGGQAANLLRELGASDVRAERSIALRAGQRWAADVSAAPQGEVAELPAIRQGALVLVTGGLGGIGLTLAEGLARCSQAKLVLLARSPLPDRSSWKAYLAEHDKDDAVSQKIQAIGRMEAAGSQVLVRAADVCDLAAMRALVAEISAEHGPLQAVIHSAGAPGRGLLALKTREVAAGVLDSKLKGTQVLEEALAGVELDYFVLCSSLATQIQAPGQVDYFAANAYLDAEAAAQPVAGDRRARPTLSIGWEAWRQVGMAVREEVSGALREGREEALSLGLEPEEGFEVFRRALASGQRQLLISTQNLPARMAAADATSAQLTEGEGSSAASADAESSNAYPRPDLATAFVEPAGANQLVVARLWRDLLGLERVGAEDGFFELGGNSLTLMQVSAGLRNQLDVILSMRELFDIPTLAEVAARVDALQTLERVAASDGDEEEGETEEFRL